MHLKTRFKRSTKGQVLAEGVASIVFVLPLVILMCFFCWEVNQYLFVQNMLDAAARNGARGCLLAYNWPQAGDNVTPSYPQGQTIDPPESGTTYTSSQPVQYKGTGGTSSTPGPASTQPTQPNEAWSRIRLGNIVTSNSQFTAYYVAPLSNNTTGQGNSNSSSVFQQGSVKVTVQAPKGVWPSPDPLGFGKNVTIQSSYTYPL